MLRSDHIGQGMKDDPKGKPSFFGCCPGFEGLAECPRSAVEQPEPPEGMEAVTRPEPDREEGLRRHRRPFSSTQGMVIFDRGWSCGISDANGARDSMSSVSLRFSIRSRRATNRSIS